MNFLEVIENSIHFLLRIFSYIFISKQRKQFLIKSDLALLKSLVYIKLNLKVKIQGHIKAMFLEHRPLAALYPPQFFLDKYNKKGRKCRRHEPTAPGDH